MIKNCYKKEKSGMEILLFVSLLAVTGVQIQCKPLFKKRGTYTSILMSLMLQRIYIEAHYSEE